MKTIEEYTRFIIEILQKDVKEGKLIIEGFEITEGKREIMIDFVFTPKKCTKKIKVTFDYNELTKKIKCSKNVLTDDNE